MVFKEGNCVQTKRSQLPIIRNEMHSETEVRVFGGGGPQVSRCCEIVSTMNSWFDNTNFQLTVETRNLSVKRKFFYPVLSAGLKRPTRFLRKGFPISACSPCRRDERTQGEPCSSRPPPDPSEIPAHVSPSTCLPSSRQTRCDRGSPVLRRCFEAPSSCASGRHLRIGLHDTPLLEER